MLSATQKDYIFKLAMEAAQSRVIDSGDKNDAVDAARAVVAAANAALTALDIEGTINVTITLTNGK
jgi:hypothetical protein